MKAVSSAAFRGLVSRRALQRQRVGILPSLMFYQQRPTHLLPSHAHTSASATMSTSVSPDAPRSGTIRIPVAPDSPDAVISWRLSKSLGGQPVFEIYHTFTPPAARGKGIAFQLADQAFALAEERKLPVLASCSYIHDTYLPARKGAAAKYNLDASTRIAALR